MSSIYDDSNRQIIPRWYRFGTACRMGDIQPQNDTQAPRIESPKSFIEKKHAWLENQSLYLAVDLVGSALILGKFTDPDVTKAAKFIKEHSNKVSSLGVQLAILFLDDKGDLLVNSVEREMKKLEIHAEIARLKQLVREYPINPIIWSDLAYLYSLIGQKKQVEHCINVALSLAGENRFILRSASRCLLYLNEPDRALFHLRRSSLINVDPWVLSAEISISEGIGKKSRFIKAGRSLVRNLNFSPWSLNELAGTLSTLETHHGTIRKSKKLMKQALVDPNENTVAQAVWLAPSLGKELVRPKEDVIAPYEAYARLHLREQEYKQSLEASKNWYKFQPFTSRPVVFASYVASVCLQDDSEAIRIIENASLSSFESFLVKNNYAFALASQNLLDKAQKVVTGINESSLDQEDSHTLSATRGLIQFRLGHIEEGRKLYQQTISGFKRKDNFRAAAIATFFWAREESLIKSTLYETTLEDAKSMVSKHDVKELIEYTKSLSKKIK